MKFSLDYCEHRASHAGLGASDSLIIPNGRIMDKNCLRPACPSSGLDPFRSHLWTLTLSGRQGVKYVQDSPPADERSSKSDP